ncbi:hypothetical protein HPC49_25695, partial [Pyxidicoccus fallax]|nr:hypothetical protein [Pyxidicoccus fallax]
MNVGQGLRALPGAILAVYLGMGCTGEKAAPAAASTHATGERTAPLEGSPFKVREINPESRPSSFFAPPTVFLELGDTVLFGASDKVHGTELWRTDGTAAGTSMVLDLLPGPTGSDPSHAVVMNGQAYFLAASTDSWQSGLWRTDGTSQGTVMVKSLQGLGSFLHQRDGVLYIGTSDPDTHGSGFALWRSDGTPEGTVRLHREPASVGGIGAHSSTWLGDTLLFTASRADQSMTLWKSDGTARGTTLVKNLSPGANYLSAFGLVTCGAQAFLWSLRDYGRYVLWRTDGSDAGTLRLKDVDTTNPENVVRPPVSWLACLGNAVYFSAWDADVGVELWKSDGTVAGTLRVADLFPGAGSASPRGFTVHEGAVYFLADDGVTGTELWRTDGTPHGTSRVADVAPGAASSTEGRPENRMISSPGALFFIADDGVHGRELWKTDGTTAGTVRLSDNGATGYGFHELHGFWSRGTLHFWSRDDELWKSNGTAEGT